MDNMEARLRAAWCQVLDMEEDEIDGDSHFFQEGGDSVAAMRLVGVAEGYKIQLDNGTIYDFPMLRNMASNSQDINLSSETSVPNTTTQDLKEDLIQACAEVCRIDAQAIEDIFPATEGQKTLLAWHMKDGSVMLQYVFQIHGPARKAFIREVVDVIRQKNQILRTRIVQHNGASYQVVVNDTVEWYEGKSLSEYRNQVFCQDGWVGYGDPLFRYAFIEEGRNLYFAYTSQHSGYDGWTNHLLFDALEAGLSDLEAMRQKPVRSHFKQFGEWLERHSAAKNDVDKSMAFWKAHLDGFQSFANRFGVAPGYKPYETARMTKIMPLKRRASVFSLSTMGHAAWTISLGNIYRHDDILFSSITSGRRFPRDDPLPGAESIMGPLQSGIHLRTRLRADQAIEDLLRDTQDQMLSMIPYQRESPLARAKIMGPQWVYLSIFNWHSIGNDIPARVIDFENPDGSITRLEGRRDLHTPFKVPIPMVLDVWEHHDHLRIILKCDEKLYDADRVALMLDQLTENLSGIAASKAKRVGDLWTMRDATNNGMVGDERRGDRHAPLAAQEALSDNSPLGTDNGDTSSTESEEGSSKLTPATTESATNGSANCKVAKPILDIPHSNSTVKISIVDTTSFVRNIPVPVFLEPPYKGFDKTDIPVYSFLIEHPPSGRKALFDLGIRKDWENLAPNAAKPIKEIGMTIDVKDDITDILQAGGIDPKDINSVIWSHSHWDHIGDPSLFPLTTDLVVGPGFKDSLLPGYPENPHSQIRSSDYHGRKLVEVSFDNDNTKTIGGFRALDFFADGSFYLLDSPGHAVGHLSALCRTTSSASPSAEEPNSSTFVYLGGDSAHHPGIFRPSSHLPLPTSITINPSPTPGLTPSTQTPILRPGATNNHNDHNNNNENHNSNNNTFASAHRLHPSPSARTEPFLLPTTTHDAPAFNTTISLMQKLDACDNVMVVIAHDTSLEGVVDTFPQGTVNGWKQRGWKERVRWRFLRDFVHAGRAEG